jgi:hypothetical protein
MMEKYVNEQTEGNDHSFQLWTPPMLFPSSGFQRFID